MAQKSGQRPGLGDMVFPFQVPCGASSQESGMFWSWDLEAGKLAQPWGSAGV